jgi:hypothetical protein
MTSQGLRLFVAAGICLLAAGCERRVPLTEEKAKEIVLARAPKREPVYAEVPQRVWWNPKAPKDDYDGKALRTLRNLEQAGLVTVTGEEQGDSGEYIARVTEKGFPLLGTAPSMRGPVFRAQIADKVYDGIRDFERHPTQETVGHAKLIWHYANPTPFYPLFETKIDKALNQPFASHISFWFEDHQWKFSVVVKKTQS